MSAVWIYCLFVSPGGAALGMSIPTLQDSHHHFLDVLRFTKDRLPPCEIRAVVKGGI